MGQMTGSFYLFTVAIDRYVEIRPILEAAVEDAKAITEVLVGRYGFSAENTTPLYDSAATRSAIIDRLHQLASKLNAKDSLVIYLSGHGDIDETGEGYFEPVDAKETSPATRLYYTDVLRIIGFTDAQHVLLIVDACFPSSLFQSRGGEFEVPQDQAVRAFAMTSREAITSGGYHEVSDKVIKGHSPFAYHLTKVLQESDSPFLLPHAIDKRIHQDVAASSPHNQSTQWAPLTYAGHRKGASFVFFLNGKTFDEYARGDQAVQAPLSITPQDEQYASLDELLDLAREERKRRSHDALDRCVAFNESVAKYLLEVSQLGDDAWATRLWDAFLREWRVEPGCVEVSDFITLRKQLGIQPWIEPITGMAFQWIPGGQFTMGSPGAEAGRQANEGPIQEVILSGFWMSEKPVTQGQYTTIMDDNRAHFQGPNRPAENLSWSDANRFCSRLRRDGERIYKLPTEAQWEYACRACSRRRFSFGDDEKVLELYGWFSANSPEGTRETGQKLANPWGLYDMHGNIYEWCLDCYKDKYPSVVQPVKDPTGPPKGNARVTRGGCFRSDAIDCRSAKRGYEGPDANKDYVGFRVVRIK